MQIILSAAYPQNDSFKITKSAGKQAFLTHAEILHCSAGKHSVQYSDCKGARKKTHNVILICVLLLTVTFENEENRLIYNSCKATHTRHCILSLSPEYCTLCDSSVCPDAINHSPMVTWAVAVGTQTKPAILYKLWHILGAKTNPHVMSMTMNAKNSL